MLQTARSIDPRSDRPAAGSRMRAASRSVTDVGVGGLAVLEPLLLRVGSARRRVRRGEYLFHAGVPFHALYGIRAGSFS